MPADGAPVPRRGRGRPAGAKTRIFAEQATIGRHHFSYLRAALEGVELRRAWATYLSFAGGPADERHFRAELRRLCRIVRSAARLHGLAEAADLALASLSRTTAGVQAATQNRFPTLEEYIEGRCNEFGIDVDFQSQDEWSDEYRHAYRLGEPERLSATALAQHPASQRRGASQELARRLQALAEVESTLARRPALADRLELWLTPAVVALLRGPERSGPGVLTLRDLIDFADLNGHRWWVKVKGLGSARARRVIGWLRPLGSGVLQYPLLASVLRSTHELAPTPDVNSSLDKESCRGFGLFPLDRLGVPRELDGRFGVWRTDRPNALGAVTDRDAIEAWLARYASSPRTQVSYSRTVERFYLWCLLVRHKPLSSVVEEDLHAWCAFAARPPADWVQPRHVQRCAAQWRPFRGPLSPLSQSHGLAVISALFSSLVQAGYLRANPARGMQPAVPLPRPHIDPRRSFNEAQWHWILATWQQSYAKAGPASDSNVPPGAESASPALPALPSSASPDQAPARARGLRRTRLILELGATTGLRRLEMATARIGNLSQEWMDGRPVWMLAVMGKASRARKVLIFDDVKALIDQHQLDLAEANMGIDRRAPMRRLLAPAPSSSGTAKIDAPPPGETGDAEEAPQSLRPLVGALRLAPPRWRVDAGGVGRLDSTGPRQADRHAALDANALAQSLKRLFKRAGATAHLADPPLDSEDFFRASTHWMRHFFAHNAVSDQIGIELVRAALGHSDLKTTSVYVNPEETALARGMTRMRRRK
jgi:integrase